MAKSPARTAMNRWVPGLRAVSSYRRGWLAKDILAGQLPKLFGFKVDADGFLGELTGFVTGLADGKANAAAAVVGIAGIVLIVMLVLVPGLFRNLPQPALAAVVITASLSLADIPATVRLWRQRKTEFLLSIAAFGGVVLLGVLPGI